MYLVHGLLCLNPTRGSYCWRWDHCCKKDNSSTERGHQPHHLLCLALLWGHTGCKAVNSFSLLSSGVWPDSEYPEPKCLIWFCAALFYFLDRKQYKEGFMEIHCKNKRVKGTRFLSSLAPCSVVELCSLSFRIFFHNKWKKLDANTSENRNNAAWGQNHTDFRLAHIVTVGSPAFVASCFWKRWRILSFRSLSVELLHEVLVLLFLALVEIVLRRLMPIG